MSALTVNQIAKEGLTVPAFSAPGAGGDSFQNTGREYVELRLGGSVNSTVTFQTPLSITGLALADQAVVLTAPGTVKCGPFAPSVFNDAGGNVNISYNGTANLTVAAFRLP